MKEYVLLPSYSWIAMEYCYEKALLNIVKLLFVTLLTLCRLECWVRKKAMNFNNEPMVKCCLFRANSTSQGMSIDEYAAMVE
jgi:hypothetical protein